MKRRKNELKQDRKVIKQALTNMLDLPKEITMNLPLISIIGNEELLIENYKGVIEYTEEKIKVNTACGILQVDGRKLFLKQITAESITVTGNILGMEYLV